MASAHSGERLDDGPHPWPWQGVQGGEGELCLGSREQTGASSLGRSTLTHDTRSELTRQSAPKAEELPEHVGEQGGARIASEL